MFIKNRTKNLLIGVVIISILIMISILIISILIKNKKLFLNKAEAIGMLILYIIAAISFFMVFIALGFYEDIWSLFDKDKDLKKIMKKEFTTQELEDFFCTQDKIDALKKFSIYLPEILQALETKEKIQVFFEQLDDEKKVKALEKLRYNLPEILQALETKEKIQVFFEQLDDEKKVECLNKLSSNLSKIFKLFSNDKELKLFFAQLDENILEKYSCYFSDIIKTLNQVNDGGLKIFFLNLNNKFLNEFSNYFVKDLIISLRTKNNIQWFFRQSKNIEKIKVLKEIEHYLPDIFAALETKEKLEWFLDQLNDEKSFKLLINFKSNLSDIFAALETKEKLEWFLDQLKDEKKVDLFNKFIKNLSYVFKILQTKEKLEWFVNNSFENYKNTKLYIENSLKIYKELNQFFLYFISYEIIDSYNQDKNDFKNIKLIEAYNQILNELLDSYKIQLDKEEKNEVINYIESSEAQTNYLRDKDYNSNYFSVNSESKDIDEDLKNEIQERKILGCFGYSFRNFINKVKEVDPEFNQIHLLMLLESIDQIGKRINKEINSKNKYWFFESFVFNMEKERLEELKPIIKNLGFFLIVLNKLIDLSYLSFDNQSDEQKFFDLILNQVIFSDQRCLDLFDQNFMIILNYFFKNPGLNNFFLEFCFIKDDLIFNDIKSIIIRAQNLENTIDDQEIMSKILNSEKTNKEIFGLKKVIILNSNIDLKDFVPFGLMYFNPDIN